MKIVDEEKWKRFSVLTSSQRESVYLIVGELIHSKEELQSDYTDSIDLSFILNDDQKEIVKEIIMSAVEGGRNLITHFNKEN